VKNAACVALISAIAADFAVPSWKDGLSRIVRAVVRNCSVAIVIAVFFTAARNPPHSPRPDLRMALTDQHFNANNVGDRGGDSGLPSSVRH
jgi:hypothetical protein